MYSGVIACLPSRAFNAWIPQCDACWRSQCKSGGWTAALCKWCLPVGFDSFCVGPPPRQGRVIGLVCRLLGLLWGVRDDLEE